MESSVSADDEGQQMINSEGGQGNDTSATSSAEVDNDDFDADIFASMMQQELIAYSVSWDPLMKVLQALGKSMARHQKTQRGNDSSIKKIQDQVVQQEQQFAALRDDVTRADDEKKQSAAVIEAMQNRVGQLQSQLKEIKELAPVEGKDEQNGTSGREQDSVDALNREDDASSVTETSPQSLQADSLKRENSGQEFNLLQENNALQKKNSSRDINLSQENDASQQNSSLSTKIANSFDGQPFVTVMDLAEAKREFREELKNALAQALASTIINGSHEQKIEDSIPTELIAQIDNGSPEQKIEDSIPTELIAQIDNGSRVIEPLSSRAHEAQPLNTISKFPKDLEDKLERLQELQDDFIGKLSNYDLLFDELNGRLGKLDSLSSQVSALLADRRSIEKPDDADGSSDVLSLSKKMNEPNIDLIFNMTSLSNDLKEIKAVQDDHDLKLRNHDIAVEKHTADIKALADSLDDLSVQQQVVASMFTRGPHNSGSLESTTTAQVSSDDFANSDKIEKQADTGLELTSQPQLDLSLVFTKLADLRHSTDASVQSLQQTIKGLLGTTQVQQEQLNALRNNLEFDKDMQVHLVEARLAMQKEMLTRNQAFQDHTKPQLAEWRKGLELTEDKLLGGISDDETLYTLQQMQRSYHRTLLSVTSLVNSPLVISETLQNLLEEVKQLQSADGSKAVPFRHGEYINLNLREQAEVKANKGDRDEEYTRKLRYLGADIDATLQVNITTEKKSDPLIKGLEAIREKLESLWSIWHRNFNVNNVQLSEAVMVRESTNSDPANDGGNGHEERHQSIQLRTSDGLREMEMRLSGAVRRLAMAEEDIERLNSLTAEITAVGTLKLQGNGDSNTIMASRRSSSNNNLRTELIMEELEKLRRDMHDEIAKLLGKLEEKNAKGSGSSNTNYKSTTSLVLPDRRNMVETAANEGDVLTKLFSQLTGQDLDSRVNISNEGQKQFYDNFTQDVAKKVLAVVNSEKGIQRGPGIGGAASANVNFRLLLDNFAQKVDDRLEDARISSTDEIARLRRDVMEQLKIRVEVAIRDIRGELMLLKPVDGDSTAVGTKPVMCVACSRPVPVSSVVREAGSLPIEMEKLEPMNLSYAAEFEYDRPDDEYVFRAGFKMPAHDRKLMALPFLTTAMRNKMVVNKPEGKRRRTPRQSYLNRVDNVVREAMELDRATRGRGVDAQ